VATLLSGLSLQRGPMYRRVLASLIRTRCRCFGTFSSRVVASFYSTRGDSRHSQNLIRAVGDELQYAEAKLQEYPSIDGFTSTVSGCVAELSKEQGDEKLSSC
jgi:hypothetical protein